MCAVTTRFTMIEAPLLGSEAQRTACDHGKGRMLAGFDGVCPDFPVADDETNECLPYGVTPTENEDRRSS